MATFEVLTSSNTIGGGGSSGSSYLVYTASMTQTGTNNPTVTVLENTLQVGSWERSGVGEFYAFFPITVFDLNKIYISGLFFNNVGQSTGVLNTDSGYDTPDGLCKFSISDNGDGTAIIVIQIQDGTGGNVELSNLSFPFLKLPKIEVYS